jgi:hypothetical protein
MKIKELEEKLRKLDAKEYRLNQQIGRELKNIIKEIGYLDVAYEELNNEEKWGWRRTFYLLGEVLSWVRIFPFTTYYHWFITLENLERELLLDLDDGLDESDATEDETQKVVGLGRKFEFEIQKLLWNLMVKYFEREERRKQNEHKKIY